MPSSVASDKRPAVRLTQPAGTVFSAYDSKSSRHGSDRTTRTRAVPLRAPTVALTRPPWSACAGATVKAPSFTVPCSPSSDQVAWSSRMKRPLSSKRRARILTVCPGSMTSSVGTTCTCAGAPGRRGHGCRDRGRRRCRRLARADRIHGVTRDEEDAAARDGSPGEHLFGRAFGPAAALRRCSAG